MQTSLRTRQASKLACLLARSIHVAPSCYSQVTYTRSLVTHRPRVVRAYQITRKKKWDRNRQCNGVESHSCPKTVLAHWTGTVHQFVCVHSGHRLPKASYRSTNLCAFRQQCESCGAPNSAFMLKTIPKFTSLCRAEQINLQNRSSLLLLEAVSPLLVGNCSTKA